MIIREKGYTLIEVIVALVLIGIIAGGMVGMIWGAQKSFSLDKDMNSSIENTNSAILMMVREIRQGIVTYPTTTTATNYITFTLGTDTISYGLVGTTLKRGLNVAYNNSSAETLAENVTTFTVTKTTTANAASNFTFDLIITVNGKTTELIDSVTPRNNITGIL